LGIINQYKTDMRTQKHDLKKKIKHLEQSLKRAILNKDAFAQFHISKDLDITKSTLYNIQ
jgi:hypothetical protein